MIDLSGQISIPFVQKRPFTGSYQGMRYILFKSVSAPSSPASDSSQAQAVLRAEVWPEPMNYEHTPDEKKHGKNFPLDPPGLSQAVAWLNEEYENHHY